MTKPAEGVDRQALALRETGRSYASIAKELGLDRSADAQGAFVRAVQEHAPDQRKELLRREADRLDVLETRIRARDRDEPEATERRLAALGRLRAALL